MLLNIRVVQFAAVEAVAALTEAWAQLATM
jgi:hypothetical protein